MPEIRHVKIAVFLSKQKSGPHATIYALDESDALDGYHVALVLRKNWWERTDGRQRAYVLRHELQHIVWLAGRAAIINHDFEIGMFFDDLFYLEQAPRDIRTIIYYVLRALSEAYETDSIREVMRRISPYRRQKKCT